MMRRAIATGLALAALAGMAAADEVVLKNGQKIVGIAREEGDRIVVEVTIGTVSFAKADVVSITPGRTLLHDYKDKADVLAGSRDAKEWYALARWAKENGLIRYVRPNLDKALECDPNFDLARRELGYVLHKGKWMTQEEVHKDMGFVWFDGRWMTPLEKELIVRRRLDAEVARLAATENRKRKQEEERLERVRTIQERYDALVEVERMRQLERRRPRGYGYGYGYGFGPYRGFYADAVPTFDVVSFLNSCGWSFGPVAPPPYPVWGKK